MPGKLDPIKTYIKENIKSLTLSLLWLVILISVIIFLIMKFTSGKTEVASYEDCLKAPGSRILESYPERCVTRDGKSFTRPLSYEEKGRLLPPTANRIDTKCITGGCNNEICQGADEEKRASICIYKAEFECYRGLRCEVQPNGQCGWTQTDEFLSCLEQKRSDSLN